MTALDLAYQALSDPTRRIMVERLAQGPASVSELARPLDMTLSAVVQHLAVLEASGLVRSQKVGRVRTCRIEPAALHGAERWIAERCAAWERHLDKLGEFLAEAEPFLPFAEPAKGRCRRNRRRRGQKQQNRCSP